MLSKDDIVGITLAEDGIEVDLLSGVLRSELKNVVIRDENGEFIS